MYGNDEEMISSWWLGIVLGIGVVGLHAGARILTHRFALDASDRLSFLWLEFGGLAGRMALLFGAVLLVLLLVEVHEVAFVSTVLTLLVVSMGVETYLIVRHMDRGALGS